MRRPDAVGFGLPAADAKHTVAFLVAEHSLGHLPVLKHQGVAGKGIVPDGHIGRYAARHIQGHTVAVLKGRDDDGRHRHPLAVVIADVAMQGVPGLVAGQHEARMGAYLEPGIALGEVLHRPRHLHGAALQPVAHLQPQTERIALGEGTCLHPQTSVTDNLKLAVACIPVLLHGIDLPVGMQLVSVRLTDGGEEYRCMAVPVGSVAAPKVFVAVFHEAHQLGAVFRHLDGYDVVADFHKAFSSGTMAKNVSGSLSLALMSACECPTGQ